MMVKIVLLASLAMVALLFLRTVLLGRLTGDYRRLRMEPEERETMRSHRLAARIMLGAMTVYVAAIEWEVRRIGGSIVDVRFVVHVCLALSCYLGIVAMVFWLDGDRSRYHAKVAYASLCCFIGTAALGVPMILQRF